MKEFDFEEIQKYINETKVSSKKLTKQQKILNNELVKPHLLKMEEMKISRKVMVDVLNNKMNVGEGEIIIKEYHLKTFFNDESKKK